MRAKLRDCAGTVFAFAFKFKLKVCSMNPMISVNINGQISLVKKDISVAAALAISGNPGTRISVSGQPRAPLCGMGVCQECRVSINGIAHQLACQTMCQPGMQIVTGQA